MDMGFLGGLPAKLSTLITNMTTLLGRVTSNVDVNVSTRAAASSALSNATWTDAKAGYLDMAVSGVARIKSIQHVYASFATGNDYTVNSNITITSVTTAKTLVIFNGLSGNADSWQTQALRLVNSTTLTFSGMRSGNSTNTLYVSAVVVEFY